MGGGYRGHTGALASKLATWVLGLAVLLGPTFDRGDLLLLTDVDADDVGRGDVVRFRRPDRTVTHRVVDRLPDGRFATRGDANAAVDPWIVRPDDVLDRYRGRIPKVGYAFRALATPLGRLATLVVAAAVVVVRVSRRRACG
jgi:signal peptidase I